MNKISLSMEAKTTIGHGRSSHCAGRRTRLDPEFGELLLQHSSAGGHRGPQASGEGVEANRQAHVAVHRGVVGQWVGLPQTPPRRACSQGYINQQRTRLVILEGDQTGRSCCKTRE